VPAARRADHHFVNKLDRERRDSFDFIDEIEQSLALDVTSASWPIGVMA
jgi:peptide chain release factor 3